MNGKNNKSEGTLLNIETSTHNVDMTKFSKSLQLSYTLNIPIQKSDAQDHFPNFQIFEDIQDQMTLVVIPPN